ncbi:MAG: acyltransferase family protein [Aeromonas sp.]
MLLSELLHKKNNNIDLFRIIAASMVIYSHGYALVSNNDKQDLVTSIIHSDSAGSIAVKIFFFLSGLVVTNSLLNNDDPWRFVISRIFRIWPALIMTTIICAFILGPIFTSLSIHDYFQDKDVYRYVINAVSMNISYTLPGVFTNNPYPNAVNGSLWTIPFEVFAYILLLAFSLIGVLKHKKVALMLSVIFLIEPWLSKRLLFSWVVPNHEVDFLSPCFAFGVIIALYKENIAIRLNVCIGFFVLYIVMNDAIYASYLLYASIFSFILYLSSNEIVLKFKPKSDISYGVYLWGFPVQQVMVHYFNSYGVMFNIITSLLCSIILAYLSWHLCEKKFINYGAIISGRISNGVYFFIKK